MFVAGTKTLVDTLAGRLSVVKVDEVGFTLAKVKYQAVINKLSASSKGNI